MTRHWRHLAIVVFLAAQFALPIGYYLRHDVYDERFAWRMFSPTRMVKCQVAFFESTDDSKQEQLSLSAEVSQPWSGWMRRGHTKIVRAFASYYCKKREAPDARHQLFVDLRCALPDMTVDQPISRHEDLCTQW